MAESLVRAAARNNAEWCDAFCRTHGVPGRFGPDFWWSPARTPPLYPDAVTLQPGVAGEQLLLGLDLSPGCSVKDSFADLDLSSAGFRPLLRAEWLAREPGRVGGNDWSTIVTGEQLATWESAWSNASTVRGFFRRALLADEAISVLARYVAGELVAGAVANRSETVIGLSNVFDTTGNLELAWQGAATASQARWGPLPVVAYDSDSSLDAARRAGFESIGELVIWLIPPESPR